MRRPSWYGSGLAVLWHNRGWWPLVRRTVRIVDFGDGTYAVGWRWSKHSRLCS